MHDLDVDDLDPVEHRQVDLPVGRVVQVEHQRPSRLGERAREGDARAELEEANPERQPGVRRALQESLLEELADEAVDAPLRQSRCGSELADADRTRRLLDDGEDRRDPADDGQRRVVSLIGTHSLIMPQSEATVNTPTQRKCGRR